MMLKIRQSSVWLASSLMIAISLPARATAIEPPPEPDVKPIIPRVLPEDGEDRQDLLPLEDIDWEASERASARITLYMTTWCGYCRAARKLLQELDADFLEKDIESDEKAQQEHLALTGGRSGVPVLTAQGMVVAGFSAEAIQSLVKQQKIWKSQRQPIPREESESEVDSADREQ